MRLSDERLNEIALNVLERKRHEIITGEAGRIVLTAETAAAIIAEVRALRTVEKAMREHLGMECADQDCTFCNDNEDALRAALAGVRALEDR